MDILKQQRFSDVMAIFAHVIKKFSTNMICIFSIFLTYTTFFKLGPQNHAHRKGRQIVKGEKEIFGLQAGFIAGLFCSAYL